MFFKYWHQQNFLKSCIHLQRQSTTGLLKKCDKNICTCLQHIVFFFSAVYMRYLFSIVTYYNIINVELLCLVSRKDNNKNAGCEPCQLALLFNVMLGLALLYEKYGAQYFVQFRTQKRLSGDKIISATAKLKKKNSTAKYLSERLLLRILGINL